MITKKELSTHYIGAKELKMTEKVPMTAREMLEKVQDIKERVVFGLLEGELDPNLDNMIGEFFEDNWMRILDILDDALTAYLEEEK